MARVSVERPELCWCWAAEVEGRVWVTFGGGIDGAIELDYVVDWAGFGSATGVMLMLDGRGGCSGLGHVWRRH